ncbi:MAG: hypothetical protein ACM31D_20185 [Bacteroidota bacterium]
MQIPGLPQFHTDLFIPTYAPAQMGDWEVRLADYVLTSGYWSSLVGVSGMAALVRNGNAWMSMTPMELESQEIGVRLAHGHVVIFGMGMGWSAAVSALREQVTSVTVVELDEDVLALHRQLDIFSQLPDWAAAKIRVEQGDAYRWTPRQPVDLLMPDIWLPLVSDGRVEEVRRMQANVQARSVYFWGQEMEIARHAAAAGRPLDADGIAATIADFDLPLIGPEFPDYPAKVHTAARQWLRGRWLPGTVPPW